MRTFNTIRLKSQKDFFGKLHGTEKAMWGSAFVGGQCAGKHGLTAEQVQRRADLLKEANAHFEEGEHPGRRSPEHPMCSVRVAHPSGYPSSDI